LQRGSTPREAVEAQVRAEEAQEHADEAHGHVERAYERSARHERAAELLEEHGNTERARWHRKAAESDRAAADDSHRDAQDE
jgi:hypothetical protein